VFVGGHSSSGALSADSRTPYERHRDAGGWNLEVVSHCARIDSPAVPHASGGSNRAAANALEAGTRTIGGLETFWALSDISFSVKEGEVVGIVGRNGAGKSTLLKILSRITEPTHGRAEIYGRVGALLEWDRFSSELTGRENVFLSGAILGMRRSEIARRFDAIVSFAEVEQFIDTPTKRYSSGMYTRLALLSPPI
jgi:ABC-type polysaccharide/polyol phosphate transport system ATPase subunit